MCGLNGFYFPENQMFEFFIRAQDKGKPALHTDVPMEVYIMGPNDSPPVFQRKDDKYFFSENSPPGKLLALDNSRDLLVSI